MTDSPWVGFTELEESETIPAPVVVEMGRRIEAGANLYPVQDKDENDPPGTVADGASYIIAATATGDWTGHEGKIATAVGTDASNGWLIRAVSEGVFAYVRDENALYRHNGSAWAIFSSGSASGGTFEVPILAAAMTPRTTNGAATGTTETTTNKVMLATLDFDASTDEFAQFMFPMPKSWDEGTVQVQFIWTAASSSGDVVWNARAVAFSNDDALDAAFGTAQAVTDTLTATGDQCTTSYTSAITIAGTPAEGDLVCFGVSRDADNGSDTLGADAKLIGIRLKYTTNTADDS